MHSDLELLIDGPITDVIAALTSSDGLTTRLAGAGACGVRALEQTVDLGYVRHRAGGTLRLGSGAATTVEWVETWNQRSPVKWSADRRLHLPNAALLVRGTIELSAPSEWRTALCVGLDIEPSWPVRIETVLSQTTQVIIQANRREFEWFVSAFRPADTRLADAIA